MPNNEIIDYVKQKATEHGVKPELALGLFEHESNFNPKAKNPKTGAAGISQLMPGTAKIFKVKDPYDYKQNADAGVRYLKDLSVKYGGDVNKILKTYGGFVTKDPSNYIKAVTSKMGKWIGPSEAEASEGPVKIKNPEIPIIPDEDIQPIQAASVTTPAQKTTAYHPEVPVIPDSEITESPKAQPKENKPGFFSRVGEDLSRRGSNIVDTLKTPSTLNWADWPVEKGLQVAGDVAGGFNDIIGEGIKSTVSSLIPDRLSEDWKTGMAKILQTPIGQKGVEALKAGVDAYGKFKESYPDAAKDIDAVMNIGAAYPLGKGVKSLAGEGVNILKDVKTLATPIGKEALDSKIEGSVTEGITKGIRPGVEGNRTSAQFKSYVSKSANAVKSILENKDNLVFNDMGQEIKGQLPKNLTQFSDAISQTKQRVFDQFDAMAKQAGEQGIQVNLNPVRDSLSAFEKSRPLQDFSKDAYKHVMARIAMLTDKTYTPSEAQEAIKILNQSLEAYYKNPSFDTASKAYIDSVIAHSLREQLDKTISNVVGDGYQGLKNQYGSLAHIEEDVNRRMIVDLRKNSRGLIDFSDIGTGAVALKGLLTLSPSTVASAAAGFGIKKLIKDRIDPNKVIERMFNDVENLSNKAKGFTPKSLAGKVIKNAVNPPKPPVAPPVKPIPKQIEYTPRMGMENFTKPGSMESGSSVKGLAGEFADKLTPKHMSDDVLYGQVYGNNSVETLMKQKEAALNPLMGISPESSSVSGIFPGKDPKAPFTKQQVKILNDTAEKGPRVLRPSVGGFTGEVGQTHDEIIASKGAKDVNRMFVSPEGKKLSRGTALRWMKENQPEQYKKLMDKGVKELHTQDYNEVMNPESEATSTPEKVIGSQAGKKTARTLVAQINSKGGIKIGNMTGEFKDILANNPMSKMLNTKTGKWGIDQMAQMLHDEGYLKDSEPQTLLNALSDKNYKAPELIEEIAARGEGTQRVDLANLNKGDKVVINGEIFTHSGRITKSGKAIWMDGEDIEVDPFETPSIKVDKVIKAKPKPKRKTIGKPIEDNE